LLVAALAASVIALVASAAAAASTLGAPFFGPSTTHGDGQGSYAAMMGSSQGQGPDAAITGSHGQRSSAGMMGSSMMGLNGNAVAAW
jgi:hypothetical protein